MIHRLIDKLTDTLAINDSILLLAAYEKHGMEWAKRSDITKDIQAFSFPGNKTHAISTNRLEKLGFFECEVRPDEKFARHKWIRVTEAGRKFLNGCYKHAQGKGVRV